jgi:transposase-like protein
LIRPIFRAASAEEARARLREALAQLVRVPPKVAALRAEDEDDILAFYAFPVDHWSKLRSTNPLERFNREIGRRTDVVGSSPTTARSSASSRCWRSRPTTSGSSPAAI